MSVIHVPKQPELSARMLGFLAAALIPLAIFIVRLWYLQVVKGDELAERAAAYRTTSVKTMAPRGLIYDRNKILLAGVTPEIVVTAVPAIVRENKWVLQKVADLVGAPVEKLEENVKEAFFRPYLPTPIFVGANVHMATKIAESADQLPGIDVSKQFMRKYADTRNLSHAMGYVWTPSEADVKRLSKQGVEEPGAYVGKDGIERVYEKELMGAPGKEKFETDNKRRLTRFLGEESPTPGAGLMLSIDSKLQRYAVQQMGSHKGAVVALDPKTGEVLCFVSTPTYDTSPFLDGISTAEWKSVNEHEGEPLFNRAASGGYSPGSTFKIITSIAAYRSGVFSTGKPEYCAGYYKVGTRKSKCEGFHSSISFNNAFARSCNSFFSSWGVKSGQDALCDAAIAVGLGADSGIDLPSESSGTVPDKAYMAKRKEKWYLGHTVNLSIGQGFVKATPLQMANVAALVANRGVNYEPHFVRAFFEREKMDKPTFVKPKVAHEVKCSPEFWNSLHRAMSGVVQYGTARRLYPISGIVWGGKTGSTEHRRGARTHAWFVGVAPLDNPKIAIAVLAEESGHGGQIAAPVARNVIAAYLGKLPNFDKAEEKPLVSPSARSASLVRPRPR